jgi:hypothetical protein
LHGYHFYKSTCSEVYVFGKKVPNRLGKRYCPDG